MKRIAILAVIGAAACVPQGKYDQNVKDLDKARVQVADDARTRAELEDQILKLQLALDFAVRTLQAGEQRIASLEGTSSELQKRLDGATALEAGLRKELEKLGKDVNKLLAEKGMLAAALDDAKARLEELRKAQAAADSRAKLYKDLAMKLRKMTDAGQLRVSLREGRIIIALPNDVLFDSGKTELKPEGRQALEQLASVLSTLDDRRFQVAGHTDNMPIHTGQFPSNWELSTSRAVEVVKVLAAEGLPAKQLSAAGYADLDPIASNDTNESRAKNRRIEITLQPNLAELPAVPDDPK